MTNLAAQTHPPLGPDPEDLPPAVAAIIGVNWLHWCLEEAMSQWETDRDDDLTRPERKLLVALDRPKRMGQLAGELGMLPSSVTAMADSASDKGMITRHRDPADRRAWLLDTTAQGQCLTLCTTAHRSRVARNNARPRA